MRLTKSYSLIFYTDETSEKGVNYGKEIFDDSRGGYG